MIEASSSSATAASGRSGGYRRPWPNERPQVLDGAMATAPQGRARPRRSPVHDRRSPLSGLRHDRPSPDPKLAGA
jgi:hypothetical protein